VADNQAGLDQAAEMRKKAEAEFHEEEKNLIESIGALKSAIVVLSRNQKKEGFLQESPAEKKKAGLIATDESVTASSHALSLVFSKQAPAEIRELLDEHFTKSETQLIQGFLAQPRAARYESQSGEIFGILKNMRETFEQNLQSSKEQEANDQKVFLELKAAKQEEISAGQQQVDSKSNELASTNEAVATARQDIQDTQNSLAADDEYLLMVKEKCAETDKEWVERQKTRQEEITAVSEAISILSSDDARDNFTKTFPDNTRVRVTKNLLLERRDFGLEPRARGHSLLDEGRELLQASLLLLDCLRLILVVQLTPTGQLFVDLLIRLLVSLQLLAHILQQLDHLRHRSLLLAAAETLRGVVLREELHARTMRLGGRGGSGGAKRHQRKADGPHDSLCAIGTASYYWWGSAFTTISRVPWVQVQTQVETARSF